MNKTIYKILSFYPPAYLCLAVLTAVSASVMRAYLNQVYNVGIFETYKIWSVVNLYVAAVFFILFLASYFKFFHKKKIFYSVEDLESLKSLTWQQFEQLTAQILRYLHYRVVEAGGAKADGGIDLVAYKKEFKYIVQCKHWKSTTVGVKVVREMFGVSIHEGASGVYIFTCGKFTKDAIEFAKEKRVYLINGYQICQLVRKLKNAG